MENSTTTVTGAKGFTGCSSVKNVTQTDIRNKNIILIVVM